MGIFSCFLFRDPQGGSVNSTVQALVPAGLRGTCYRWPKSNDTASNSGGWLQLPKCHPGASKPSRIFVFFSCKTLVLLASRCVLHQYSCRSSSYSCARVLLEQYALVQQQKQQAHECYSSRVLLECCWVLLLLLLNARVPVTAWPRCARAIE